MKTLLLLISIIKNINLFNILTQKRKVKMREKENEYKYRVVFYSFLQFTCSFESHIYRESNVS